MKTGLFIIGAQKAATTTLFELLSTSDCICGAAEKEPHFFSTRNDWRDALAEYEALFDRREGAIGLEASTSYTFYPQRRLAIWDDIHEYNPAARFNYIVRNPLDRIIAAWRHSAARGYGQLSFADYVRKNPLPIRASRYSTQVLPFIRRFGREQVLLLDFADIVARQGATLAQVARFVGLPSDHFADVPPLSANSAEEGKLPHWFDRIPAPVVSMGQRFPGPWHSLTGTLRTPPPEKPVVEPALRHAIGDLLESEIRGIESLMQRDFSAWRSSLR